MAPSRLANRLTEAGQFFADVADIVDGRLVDATAPKWALARGFESFLRALSDEELVFAESHGLDPLVQQRDAPPELRDLVAMCEKIRHVEERPAVQPDQALVGVAARKQVQIHSLLQLARQTSVPARVVDVGAGHGHLTRQLALALGTEAVGFELDGERVTRAQALSAAEQNPARFERRDAIGEGLNPSTDELMVGLHACGALGDALVQHAARAKCRLLLVSCCPQKIPGAERRPLSKVGASVGLRFSKSTLGLANIVARRQGVETSTENNVRARQTRYALSLLLKERGIPGTPAEHSRGINRRQMLKGLEAVSRPVLQRRRLAPARESELRKIESRAVREYAAIRRYTLVRTALGRPLEVSIVFDRAVALEEAGLEAEVFEAFPQNVSPRNLTIVSAPR